MARATSRRTVAVLCTLIGLTLVASATATDVAVVPAGPVSVRLVQHGKVRSGDVTVLLRNDGTKLVRLRYFFLPGPDGRLMPVPNRLPSPLPPEAPVLATVSTPPPSLRAGHFSVHVRDLYIWPLVFVLLGALAGGFGTRWWERNRRRDVVRKSVKETLERYLDAVPAAGSPFQIYFLAEFRKPELDDLFRRIDDARDSVDFDPLTDEVLRLDAEVGRWSSILSSATSLAATVPVLDDDLHEIREDTRSVLDTVQDRPVDDKAAGTLIGNLRRQRRVLDAFLVDWYLWSYPPRLPEQADPRSVYSSNAYSSEEATQLTVARLRPSRARSRRCGTTRQSDSRPKPVWSTSGCRGSAHSMRERGHGSSHASRRSRTSILPGRSRRTAARRSKSRATYASTTSPSR